MSQKWENNVKRAMWFALSKDQCKAEQLLQGTELQEKEKDQRHIEKLFRKNPKLKVFI